MCLSTRPLAYGSIHRAATAVGELNIGYSYNGPEGCLGEALLGRDALPVLDLV